MSEMKFDTDGNKLIDVIQDAVRTEIINVEVGQHTTRPVYRVDERPLVQTLGVSSLTGFADYVNEDIDKKVRSSIFVQVVSPTEVKFKCGLEHKEDRRVVPLIAKADTPTLSFDNYLRLEEVMIMLQARFVDTEIRADLLSKLGNIVADEELQQEDDGVGQTVTIQKGIMRSGQTIKNPVLLRPFRTFTEIEQPESPFIIRLKKDDNAGILVGVFEADGGAWRNAARLLIKEFIDTAINSGDVAKIPVIA